MHYDTPSYFSGLRLLSSLETGITRDPETERLPPPGDMAPPANRKGLERFLLESSLQYKVPNLKMLKEGFLFTFISAFMALFPVANPVGAGFLVNGLLSGLNDEDRRSIIRRIVTDYLLVGLGSLAVGHFVLSLFGLSLPVIQLGGGLLICRTALQWLGDSDSSVGRTQGKDVNPIHKSAIESQIFYPITFPISIGPGSVSVILTLMASVSMKNGWARGLLSYAIIALVIVLMCLILYLFLSQGERIIRKIGNSGSIVINKMVAFFTFCVGVQIVVTGIAKLFNLHV